MDAQTAIGDDASGATDAIRIVVGGSVRAIRDVAPAKTVLAYLREDLGRTGTKEGCAEGDCGACTVVVAELAAGGVAFKAVNACIQFLPALDGKALCTVEDLRTADGGLHPVQQAMVACHGSQCGFCTPGFVMSLWALYLEHAERGTRPTERELRTGLAGNLCRCTGYRPILEAGQRMFDAPSVTFDRDALSAMLERLSRDRTFRYEHDGERFLAPRTIDALVELKAAYPQATILAGGTDVGLWATKKLQPLPEILYAGEIAELRRIRVEDGMLRIGAGASLEDAYRALAQHYPELTEMWERFASPPIRNAGTMGGNVANGSPIGDSMPALIALAAQVTLRSRRGARSLPLEDLYVGYMRKAMADDEIVEAIAVPLPSPALRFRTYKISKRYDSDISAVCAAFAVELDGATIARCRIAFGGMAATPARARSTETALVAQHWDEATVRMAMTALDADFTPLTDMRASAAYRLQAARNLLYRFFLETQPDRALDPAQVSVHAFAEQNRRA